MPVTADGGVRRVNDASVDTASAGQVGNTVTKITGKTNARMHAPAFAPPSSVARADPPRVVRVAVKVVPTASSWHGAVRLFCEHCALIGWDPRAVSCVEEEARAREGEKRRRPRRNSLRLQDRSLPQSSGFRPLHFLESLQSRAEQTKKTKIKKIRTMMSEEATTPLLEAACALGGNDCSFFRMLLVYPLCQALTSIHSGHTCSGCITDV